MEREIRRVMLVFLSIGFALAVAVGVAAGDRGMIQGATAAFIGGLIATPFVARMWQ